MSEILPSQEALCLKTINQLPLQFLIPTYQRGYRWTADQVKQLLDDVASFEVKSGAPFYCLQPIVVRWRAASQAWELIDGQQRLTTIWLILEALRQRGKPVISYGLHFASDARKDFDDATLKQIAQGELQATDFDSLEVFYIHHAYQCIVTWLSKADAPVDTLCNNLQNLTKVIWYQLPAISDEEDKPDTSAQAVFTRLNAGKIPLTNAELIKALLLQRQAAGVGGQAGYAPRQFEIAADWDWIEAELFRPEFWGWLRQNEESEGKPRLETLLRLLAPASTGGAYALFTYVEGELKADTRKERLKKAEAYWDKAKALFLQLLSWFEDPDSYHRIGYLLAARTPLRELIEQAENRSKPDFRAWLKAQIQDKAVFPDGDPDDEWDTLRYPDQRLHRILLLHNVATAWQARATGGRFPFHRFRDGWSLEHIHPQNPKAGADYPNRRETLEEMQRQLGSESPQPSAPQLSNPIADEPKRLLAGRIKAALELLPTQADQLASEFMKLRVEYLQLTSDINSESEEELHGLGNMALLSSQHNSALNNGSFPEKRTKVMALSQDADQFVPPATRDVFLKAFQVNDRKLPPKIQGMEQQEWLKRFGQPHPSLTYWSNIDRARYRQAMRQTILDFLR